MPTINVKLSNGKMQPMSYPDGWTDGQIKDAIMKHFPGDTDRDEPEPNNQQQIDQEERQKGTTGFKGLAQDAISLLGNALSSGSQFVMRAPGNIAEIGSELINHPLSYPPHVARQVLAGLGEGAKGIANIPHQIFDELADKEITPNWLRTGSIPEDTGVEKLLGLEPKNKSDELLRAIPSLYGVGKIAGSGLKAGRAKLSPPDLKQALRDTQKKVDLATKDAGKVFNSIENTLESEGKSIVAIDADLINDASSLLSNKYKNIIKNAESGDYKALRKLQSALGDKQRKGLSSKNLADIDQAENIGVIRDGINKAIQDHLESNGFKDLANSLNETRAKYANIQETYYSNPQLAGVFGKSQKIPKNPKTLLTQESKEINRFLDAHPELVEALSKTLKHDKRMRKLGLVGGALGIGTTAGGVANYLGGK